MNNELNNEIKIIVAEKRKREAFAEIPRANPPLL